MTENQHKINQLFSAVERLLKKQESISSDITLLRNEIQKIQDDELKNETRKEFRQEEEKTITPSPSVNEPIREKEVVTPPILDQTKEKEEIIYMSSHERFKEEKSAQKTIVSKSKTPKSKNDLEKFIGENLINKIGIAITVIGVALGTKYSIENDLVSPLTRIILGYLAGIGLLGFGIKLKKKYENYSAVLVSGAIAIMYFITFSAYNFYQLIPQTMAFVLMVIFTIFSVIAAINYNKQIIAHIGLVGAYAIPFLLSDGSGRVGVLYSYMAIINIGILIISFKKYWKPLYYSSFGLTWLIVLVWFATEYLTDKHFSLALTFITIFFVTFYLTFLAYKLIKNEKFGIENIILLLINSFIFYGLGYAILSDHETGKELVGLFTLCNAVIHFIVSVVIYRKKLADKNLFYLIAGLVLVFITITIPVQLDGNWVTLLWAAEAILLFWIGRTKQIPVYEKLSYIVMAIAFLSLIQDWGNAYDFYGYSEEKNMPIFNIHFFTYLFVIGVFGGIHFLNNNKKYIPAFGTKNQLSAIISFAIPALIIFISYIAIRLEISMYWDQVLENSTISSNDNSTNYFGNHKNYSIKSFKAIWIINYSLVFFSILAFLNLKKIKSKSLTYISLGLMTLMIFGFLFRSLYEISELRETYLDQTLSEYYPRGLFYIGIRYVSFVFVAITLFLCYRSIRQDFVQKKLDIPFNILLHVAILWIASSELIHWMDIGESEQSYKLGLSILWGIYALLLIILGIWKKKQYLRIMAIVLFAITLIKLFAYDIAHLNTISKTIVFVSLGVLLLIISFLYNKYKNKIANETTD
ncbi:membrane protein [Dokdonia pacifica]|uniref:Predicted membrane protein n=1 Tax=Dokdonia pacifica TaxID=1627892 RepID=A0A239B222_9FLAO|nr:DUF2339 domain-containing protein [Dokdonia pacifica]GGG32703.1 membrane protein [Dokdonia pacifica]SNS01253.1 Predicted membrane protein [Dokdonia pacifica]